MDKYQFSEHPEADIDTDEKYNLAMRGGNLAIYILAEHADLLWG